MNSQGPAQRIMLTLGRRWISGDAIMPGVGFIIMALEAMHQKYRALLQPEDAVNVAPNDLCYRFWNVRFSRALVIEEGQDVLITFTLTKVPGSKN